jgi:type I restriction enzyme S subunit
MELKPGYKQTEVGVIPEDWEVKRLGEVAEFRAGTYLAQAEWRDGEYEVHGAGGVMGSHAVPNFRKSISVVGRVGTIGRPRYVPAGCWVNNNAGAIVARAFDATPGFVNLVLLTVDWSKATSVTAQPFLVVPSLLGTELAVPGLAEQTAIAAALSDADALLGGLDRLIAKKRDLKQAARQQLLTGQTRLPGFRGEWEEKLLGQCCRLGSGTYLAQDAYRDGKFEVQGAGGAMGKHVVPNFSESISVIGRVGTVGRPRFMPAGCWVNNNAAAVIALPGCATPQFVHLLLMTMDWRKAISVTAQPFLVVESLMKMTFRLPSIAEQTAIATVLSDMDAELATLEARRAKTRDLKQAMMQELLTGRTRLVAAGGSHG